MCILRAALIALLTAEASAHAVSQQQHALVANASSSEASHEQQLLELRQQIEFYKAAVDAVTVLVDSEDELLEDFNATVQEDFRAPILGIAAGAAAAHIAAAAGHAAAVSHMYRHPVLRCQILRPCPTCLPIRRCVNVAPPHPFYRPACFHRDSALACRSKKSSDAAAAYTACFGASASATTTAASRAAESRAAESSAATLVPLAALVAGDRIVSIDAQAHAFLDRVAVVQHKRSNVPAPFLEIVATNGGVLSVTPDHVISLDGAMRAAREAAPGKQLTTPMGPVTIRAVVERNGRVVNPITLSGTILIADSAAAASAPPILASTATEWAAALVLSGALRYTLALGGLTYAFPVSSEAYFAALEAHGLEAATPLLEAAGGALGSWSIALQLAGLVVLDAALVVGFVLYSCVSLRVLATLATALVYCRAAHKLRRPLER